MIELPARRVRVLSLVVAALTFGLMAAGRTSAQVISGASPTFTLNTITGNTAVLSIVPDTNAVSGQATPAVASMTSSAGGVLAVRGTATGTQTAGFRAYLRYGGGAPLDVTQTAAWDFTATPPPGSAIMRGTLAFPALTNTTTFGILASIGDPLGRYASTTTLTYNPLFWARIGEPTVDWLGGTSFRLNLAATATGAAASPPAGPLAFMWDLDDDKEYDDAVGASIAVPTNSLGGNLWVGVRASQNGVLSHGDRRKVTINNPLAVGELAAGDSYEPSPASSGLKNSAGGAFVGTEARRDVGLIIITHGIWTDESDSWFMQMAEAIEQELEGNLPNVAVYDWAWDSHGLLRAAPPVVEAVAKSHGQLLASRLLLDSPALVNLDMPIHLIGHSAGGIVMGECALHLKKLDYVVDRITMLDTPAFCRAHLEPKPDRNSLPNPGVVERIISSAIGMVPGPKLFESSLLPFYQVIVTEPGNQDQIPPVYAGFGWGSHGASPVPMTWTLFEDHSSAHTPWYRDSIAGIESGGFQDSPFMNSASVVPKVLPFSAPQALAIDEPATLAQLTEIPLTNFTFFGSVSVTTGVYTCVEDVNAGLIAPVTLPPDIDELRFAYRFSGTNDGDFLTVRLGTGFDLFYGLDLPLSRTNFLDAAVDLRAYATISTQLVFTLVSRGTAGCVVSLKDIRLVTNDDVDGDGLVTTQELAIGTSPQLWDTDGDGLDDRTEIEVYRTDPTLADTDGDGMSDADEIAAGTDPLDAASRLQVVDIGRSALGDVVLRWAAQTGQTYTVLSATDVTFRAYSIEASGLTGTTDLVTFTNSSPRDATGPRGFYRVRTP